ncbi:MAG: FG-GAP-like repeat-containing protein [Myxococcaceae bacterium]|nr:FG-GAP-like repeat-containing protein [Myxococcaceae bacterium]
MRWLVCATTLLVARASGPQPAPGRTLTVDDVRPLVEAAEYRPSTRDRHPTAPNRAQGLRARWTPAGTRLEDRTSGAWLMTLTTRSVGRPGRLVPLPDGPATVDEALVTRDFGAVREWWRNTPEGLEQAWSFAERPHGDGPLSIEVDVDGATVTAAGERLALASHAGRQLVYDHLEVLDAEGKVLPARLAVRPAGWRVEVDDTLASYPITIDPLVRAERKILDAPRGGREFGLSIANVGDLDGDGLPDIAVGDPGIDQGEPNEGAIMLYRTTPIGPEQTPLAIFEGGSVGTRLGETVAAAGDVNCDGRPDVVATAATLPVRLFLGAERGLDPSPWKGQFPDAGVEGTSDLRATSAGDVDDDGCSDLVVGARFCDRPEQNEGCVFLFLGRDAGLSEFPAAILDSNMPQALFGSSLASGNLDSDRFSDLVIGAPGYAQGSSGEGAMFSYAGTIDGGLRPLPVYESNVQGAFAGSSVVMPGDLDGDGDAEVLVGEPGFDGGQGRVAVFSGPSPTAPRYLVPPVPTLDFGAELAAVGDLNADGYADFAVQTEEHVWVYRGGPGAPSSRPDFTVAAAAASPGPVSTALRSAAGADLDDDGFTDLLVGRAVIGSGQIDWQRGQADGPDASFLVAKGQARDELGASLASAGDVNADGFSDLLIGAPGVMASAGAALLLLGEADGRPVSMNVVARGDPGDALGSSVAGVGDVNGDGLGDVVVGRPGRRLAEGGATLLLGRRGALPEASSWEPVGASPTSRLGASVAGAGDVNGDGYADVIVGAPEFSDTRLRAGRALIYLGGAAGLRASPDWTVEGDLAGARLGASVSSAGDVNGDGFSDVLVGVPSTGQRPGECRVYLGGPSGPQTSASWVGRGAGAGDRFGESVAAAGDVDADGRGDVVIGAPGAADGGAVFLFPSTSMGFPAIAGWTRAGRFDEALGAAVAGAGDVDGDGRGDLLVGAPLARGGEGRASLFVGAALPSPMDTPRWVQTGVESTERLGFAVASAGDVNGDGFADVLIADRDLESALSFSGQVHLALGGDRLPGRSLGLSQRFPDDPVGPGGRLVLPERAKLTMTLRDSLGTGGKLRLQVEVKPIGVPFDGGVTAQSAPQRPGLASAEPVLPVGRYHWRARLESNTVTSRWVPFGANREDEPDFVVVPPVTAGGAGGGGAGGGAAGGSSGGDAGGTPVIDAGPVEEPEVHPPPAVTFVPNGCGCSGGAGGVPPLVLLVWALARRARR